MANVNILAKFIFSFEGGYVNDHIDRGGATNHGVTLATWRAYGWDKNGDKKIDNTDIKLLTIQDATYILKTKFWNKCLGDQINSQSIANLIVDWYWGSGVKGIKRVQRVLGVKSDGIFGQNTLKAINSYKNERELFNKLWKAHQDFYVSIAKASLFQYERKKGRKATYYEKKTYTQYKFLNGWLRRLDGIQYGRLIDNRGKEIDY